jgi:hypothetical protein
MVYVLGTQHALSSSTIRLPTSGVRTNTDGGKRAMGNYDGILVGCTRVETSVQHQYLPMRCPSNKRSRDCRFIPKKGVFVNTDGGG